MKTRLTALTIAVAVVLPLAAEAAKYTEVEVANGGTVSGKVTFSGDDPAPNVYTISKDNDVCGTGTREIDYVRVNGDALNDVVVYLDKVKEGKPFPAELSKTEINQENCEFKPFLQVMKNGTDLDAINSDPVLHNIHTYEIMGRAKKTVFNVSQPKPGTVTKAVKLKRGDAMKVECDAHDFMHGFVFVAKSPYSVQVADDGSYTIDNVPAGKYKIVAWHGTLKEQKGEVEVTADGTATADFAFKE
ncbi:MAG: carboxypeptidase regulatory-like domain-containing protein [Pseudomonadota bacterium]|nr:carboxypeptidase regulatory-like domain-containing protein [Pseudomonadota bacterium]